MRPKVSKTNYDFSGWATKNDLTCLDGRVIGKDAFAHNDQKIVPLVWSHIHDDPGRVIGQALLENLPDGVKTYALFNNNPKALEAKECVAHGDVNSISIWAGQLQHKLNKVVHGDIKEVSLCLAGANPGAVIEDVYISHGDPDLADPTDEALIFCDQPLELMHSDDKSSKDEDPEDKSKKKKDDSEGESKKEDETDLKEIYDTLNEDQKTLVQALVGEALAQGESNVKHSDDEGEEDMKYNAFDGTGVAGGSAVLSHSDEMAIIAAAKANGGGSFQAALQNFADEHLAHYAGEIAPATGFKQVPTEGKYGIEALFPDYKEARGTDKPPQMITNDMGWVDVVLNKVHKSPISRIRTSITDIRNIEALKAKGYVKGRKKALTGNIEFIRRTTDPQTIYVKNQLHRDDILDIEDFDYVQYLYEIDRMNLRETLALAIMFGDGREDSSDDKIFPEHIRPIWTDDDLYTLHVNLDIEAARAELQGSETDSYFGENYITAEAMVNTLLYARENFKGTGTPDCFLTPHMLNVMLLARDRNGRRIYAGKGELASVLNVGNIYTVEQMAGKTRTTTVSGSEVTKKLHAIVGNLNDYSLGSMKGGEITHFTQFDIDFNQQKSLLETRCSGALTRVYSMIAVEEIVTA